MSFSWYFHSFNSKDLENEILKGQGTYTIDEEINNIDLKVRKELQTAEFDYNKLVKKYWKYLDQYLTNSILALKETEQVSPDHAHWKVWAEFAALHDAKPKEIFDALSSDGRQYNFTEKKKPFFLKIKSAYDGFTRKNRPDYIIIKGDELRIFVQSLKRIFESTDEGFFEKLGGKEELRPYFLEPFVRAYEKEKAILGILT